MITATAAGAAHCGRSTEAHKPLRHSLSCEVRDHDGIVVVPNQRRRAMYFETSRAVGEHVQHERTDDGGWRAAFDGAFTVAAEARTPDAALMELERQLDRLVAEWVVHQFQRMGRPERETTSRARRNSIRGPREGAR
jgi:hypothetical protein